MKKSRVATEWFLQPRGLMSIAWKSFRLYFQILPVLIFLATLLFGIVFIIVFLGSLLLTQLSPQEANVIMGVVLSLGFYVAYVYFYAAATIAVSLRMIGSKAGVMQILRRLSGAVAIQLLGTGFLQILAVCGGFILLIIPGVIFMIRYQFAQPVVVLERTTYASALRRSRELVTGSWWRVFGAFWLSVSIFIIGALIFGLILYFPLVSLGLPDVQALTIAYIAFYLVLPVLFIYSVLLYYDLRIRKEALNVETLREAV